MPNNYAIDFETPLDNARDPQMQNASTAMGICLVCGELFPEAELERNDGMCLACFYASLEPDPDDVELFEEELTECSNECGFYYNCKGGCGCGTHEPCRLAKRKGGSADGGKR